MRRFSLKSIFPAIVVLLACSPLARAGKFTIPVFPDTQCAVNRNPAMFTSQLKWIVDNRKRLEIPFVLHVGDIVDWDTPDHRMWKTASEGFEMLDGAKIPYALAVGNHDCAAVKVGGSAAPGNVNANLRDTTQFNAFFPVGRFPAQMGRFQPGKSDNAWYVFNAGGLNWLVLTLEFCARQGPVDWAQKVLADHPNENVIVLTHFHLKPDGTINGNNAGYGDLTTRRIFDELIATHPNVLLVLSGHLDHSAWREDVGKGGNRIYEILQDYQTTDLGGGYLRLLDIDTDAGTIDARMYSPYYDRTLEDASKFSIAGVKFLGAKNTGGGSPTESRR